MVIGTLEGLRRYPVKSLRGEVNDTLEISPTGIPGDRADALVVRSGHARAGKTYRGKEHERLHLLTDPQTAIEAAAERGAALALEHGDHFFDDAPISLIVDRWLDDLSAHVGYRVEWERFRPNFFVRAAPEFGLSEEALSDAELELGTVRLRVRYPIERCVTPTYHLSGAASDPRILRFITQTHNAWMGIYCDVIVPGAITVGDLVILRQAQDDTWERPSTEPVPSERGESKGSG